MAQAKKKPATPKLQQKAPQKRVLVKSIDPNVYGIFRNKSYTPDIVPEWLCNELDYQTFTADMCFLKYQPALQDYIPFKNENDNPQKLPWFTAYEEDFTNFDNKSPNPSENYTYRLGNATIGGKQIPMRSLHLVGRWCDNSTTSFQNWRYGLYSPGIRFSVFNGSNNESSKHWEIVSNVENEMAFLNQDQCLSEVPTMILKGGENQYGIDDVKGLVGIGTNSPTSMLSLGGNEHPNKLSLLDDGSGSNRIGLGAESTRMIFHLNDAYDGSYSWLEGIGNNEWMSLKGGKLGINSVSPANSLTVGGGASIGSGYSAIASPSNGAIIEGKVGIGNSSPSSLLSLDNSSSDNKFSLYQDIGTGTSRIGLGAHKTFTGTTANHNMVFHLAPSDGINKFSWKSSESGAEWMTLDRSKLGIGNTSPQSALSVTGGATFGAGWGSIGASDGTVLVHDKLSIGSSTFPNSSTKLFSKDGESHFYSISNGTNIFGTRTEAGGIFGRFVRGSIVEAFGELYNPTNGANIIGQQIWANGGTNGSVESNYLSNSSVSGLVALAAKGSDITGGYFGATGTNNTLDGFVEATGVHAQAIGACLSIGLYATATTTGCASPCTTSSGVKQAWAIKANGNCQISGGTWQTSDAKLKKEVKDLEDPISMIMKLKPKSYRFRNDIVGLNLPDEDQFGFIAQDVEKEFPNLVKDVFQVAKYDSARVMIQQDINYKVMNYQNIIAISIGAIKQLNARIDSLSNVLSKLQLQVANPLINNDKKAILGDNIPNPFSEETRIPYQVVGTFSQAFLGIYNLLGEELESYPINESGGEILVQSSKLKSGIYNYSLVVDGKELLTKKMVLTR